MAGAGLDLKRLPPGLYFSLVSASFPRTPARHTSKIGVQLCNTSDRQLVRMIATGFGCGRGGGYHISIALVARVACVCVVRTTGAVTASQCAHTRRVSAYVCLPAPQLVDLHAPPAPFSLRHKQVTLRPRAYCMVPIRFSPTVPGNTTATVRVTGRVVGPKPVVAPSSAGDDAAFIAPGEDKVWRVASGRTGAAVARNGTSAGAARGSASGAAVPWRQPVVLVAELGLLGTALR